MGVGGGRTDGWMVQGGGGGGADVLRPRAPLPAIRPRRVPVTTGQAARLGGWRDDAIGDNLNYGVARLLFFFVGCMVRLWCDCVHVLGGVRGGAGGERGRA